jgi:hypothetical protein
VAHYDAVTKPRPFAEVPGQVGVTNVGVAVGAVAGGAVAWRFDDACFLPLPQRRGVDAEAVGQLPDCERFGGVLSRALSAAVTSACGSSNRGVEGGLVVAVRAAHEVDGGLVTVSGAQRHECAQGSGVQVGVAAPPLR